MPRRKKSTFGLPRLHIKPETFNTILFILFIVFAIISSLSFLQSGEVLTQIHQIFVNLFGFFAIGVPFWLILIAFIFAQIRSPFKEANIFFGFHLLFFSLIILSKQGLVGDFAWVRLEELLTQPVAILALSGVTIVGFVIFFDTSIAQIVKILSQVLSTIHRYTFGRLPKSSGKYNQDKKDVKFVKDEQLSNKQIQPPLPMDKKMPETVGVKPVLTANRSSASTENKVWQYPSMDIFDDKEGAKADRGDVNKNAQIIEKTLDSFGITARVVEVNKGPSVTQYALEVALGTKLAKIVSLSNDMAMALAAPGGQIRVEAPIPGRALVGIEVPNRSLEVVPIRKILDSQAMHESKNKISVPLGLDVAGHARVANIAKMPHVLIAGQTGSGKSVCVNSWISTILFRASPEEVKMIMVDPKRVELTPYNGIPHLLTPVITEPEKILSALKWATSEMDRRYKLFAEVQAKNIESYHEIAGFTNMPYILFIIDELADIMLFSPSDVENYICRIAQMARATGIHLVLATQRPSVDVLTGLIKANVPTRIAFAVASMTDSRVILDTPGAEKLLGRGDMLYIPPDLAKPVRIQGCFISDKETSRLLDYVRSQRAPEYDETVVSQQVSMGGKNNAHGLQLNDAGDRDPLFDETVKLVQETGKASASLLQRRFKLGYARAARVLDELQQAGIIGPSNGAKPRDILVPHNNDSGNE